MIAIGSPDEVRSARTETRVFVNTTREREVGAQRGSGAVRPSAVHGRWGNPSQRQCARRTTTPGRCACRALWPRTSAGSSNAMHKELGIFFLPNWCRSQNFLKKNLTR